MKNKEDIKELLNYFQNADDEPVVFNEDAIISAYQNENDKQSLIIKVLSIIGGILASFAFVGFLIVAGLYNSDTGLLVFGIILIAGSIIINKKQDQILLDTISISSFIIGFVLLGFGFTEMHADENFICMLFIIIAASTLFIVQSYMLSFVSVLTINGCILTIIIINNKYDLIQMYLSLLAWVITYFFLNEAKILKGNIKLSRLYDPMRIGLTLSFLTGFIFVVKREIFNISSNYSLLYSLMIIAAILYLISLLFNTLNIVKWQQKIVIYAITILTLLPTALSPAITGAILIMLLSFMVNYKTGLALGIISFIYFISQFYYDLQVTLLTKSILLFSTGVLFIILYILTYKKIYCK